MDRGLGHLSDHTVSGRVTSTGQWAYVPFKDPKPGMGCGQR
jgi:hypothetical protein